MENAFNAMMGGMNAGYSQQQARQNLEIGRFEMEQARAKMEAERQAAMLRQQQAQLEAQRQQRQAGIYAGHYAIPRRLAAGAMDGRSAPMGNAMAPQPAQPMPQGGAPMQIAPSAPQAVGGSQTIVAPDGGQVEQVNITDQRQRAPDPWEGLRAAPTRELNEQLMMSAYQAGDTEDFIRLATAYHATKTTQEKEAGKAVAAMATSILDLPAEQRPAAVMEAIQRAGIDPSQTDLDDIRDPAQLERALRFEQAKGDPEAALKAANLPLESLNLGNAYGMVNQRTGRLESRFRIAQSPDSVASNATTQRGQTLQAQTARAQMANTQRVAQINNAAQMARAQLASRTDLTIAQRRAAEAALDRGLKQQLAQENRAHDAEMIRLRGQVGAPEGAPASGSTGVDWDE